MHSGSRSRRAHSITLLQNDKILVKEVLLSLVQHCETHCCEQFITDTDLVLCALEDRVIV